MRSLKRDELESSVEIPVTVYAKARGWLVRKIKWIGRRAAPDRLFARNGVIVFVEFKRPGEDLRPDQVREVRRMRKKGITVHVIDDVEEGKALFV